MPAYFPVCVIAGHFLRRLICFIFFAGKKKDVDFFIYLC